MATPERQREAADIIERSVNRVSVRPKAGRPAKRIPDLSMEQVVGLVDELWFCHLEAGHPHPHDAAMEEAAALENISIETMRRYFSKGSRLRASWEIRYLEEFERLVGSTGEIGALDIIAGESGMPTAMAARMLDRARKARENGK